MTIDIKGLGKVTASKDVLNQIALLAAEASDHYTVTGTQGLANWAEYIHSQIYETLDKTGYYK